MVMIGVDPHKRTHTGVDALHQRIAARDTIPLVFNEWLALVAVAVDWGDQPVGWEERPRLVLRPRGLAGAIGLQAVLFVGGADCPEICAGCGQPFMPTRKPRPGAPAWCSREACRRARLRANQRAKRARDRARATEGDEDG
jgi:hypothetical protein